MNKALISAFAIGLLSTSLPALFSQESSGVLVFREEGFPVADSASPSPAQLQTLLPRARFASTQELPGLLDSASTKLFVLPYGSAFPEEAWPNIYQYLNRGGNLLVLGGRPFTRAAYHDTSGWHLRDYSVRFTRPLMIDQYQETAGSDGLEFQENPDLAVLIPKFAWKQAFSPVIRLSAVDLYHRGGATGSIDARVDTIAWGVKGGRKLAAPVIEIDHLRNGFDGGRWIFVNDELPADFYSRAEAGPIVQALVERSMRGSEEFLVRPVLPLYLPGEPIQLNVVWHSAEQQGVATTVKISVFPEAEPSQRSGTTVALSSSEAIVLPAPTAKGLFIIEAQLMEGNQVSAVYHSGFWIRDEAYLRSGPRLTVNKDYFELDGHPLAVVGTTYMSGEAQRLYFEYPNVYVWNQELGEIHGAALNMIRTGWWTGWDKFCNENGEPYDRTLRTLEAYLMTARKYGLPVQFNFFAFLPEVLGGVNPYLDPQAERRQRTLISLVVARFHDVPFLAWDFINEPSISQHLWTMRPNGDPIELASWNAWLAKRYPDRAALAAAWNLPVPAGQGTIPLPDDIEFTLRS